jgi:hypothetical protein
MLEVRDEIAGYSVSDFRYLHCGGRDDCADRPRTYGAGCAGEQRERAVTGTALAAERITALVLLVLCVVVAAFV